MTTPKGAREQVKDLVQELIMTKATELFYDRGYEGTSMDALASELGVSKKHLYAHYQGKADILAEIVGRAEAIALSALRLETHSSRPPDQRFLRALNSYVSGALANPKLVAVFLSESRKLPQETLAPVDKMIEEWVSGMASILEAGKQCGVFHFNDAAVTVRLIMGSVIWTYAWADVQSSEARRAIADEVIQGAFRLAGGKVPDAC